MTKGCGMGAVAIRAAGLVVFCWLLGAPLGARAAEPADLLGEARMLRGQGDYAAALRAYSQAFLQHPRPSELLVERGQTHVAAGNLAAANIDFTEAIRLDPENAAAYKARAATTWDAGDAEFALEDYHEARRLRPNDAEARLGLAAAYDYLYCQYFTTPFRFGGGFKDDHREVLNAIEERLALVKERIRPDRLTVMVSAGRFSVPADCINTKRLLEAVSEDLAEDPTDTRNRALRALLLSKLQKPEAAIEDLSFLIAEHPNVALYYELRGDEQKTLGNLAAAIKDYSAAIDLLEHDTRLLIERSLCYARLGQSKEEAADLEAVLREEPDHPDAAASLAFCYFQEARLDDVERVIESAVKAHPEHANVRLMRGLILHQQKDYEGAIREYSAAISLKFSPLANALVRRGRAYVALRKWELADADFTEAARLSAKNLEAYKGRGMVALARGDFKAAVRHAEQMLSIAPDDREANDFFKYAMLVAYGTGISSLEVTLPNLVAEAHPGLQTAIARRLNQTVETIAPGPLASAITQERYSILDQCVTLQRVMACLSEELKNDPSDADGLLVRALLHVAINRPDLALPDLQKLVEAHPEQRVYRVLYGFALLQNQQPAGIAQLDLVLKSAPDNVAAVYYRALCHEAAKENEQALGMLDMVVARAPTNAEAAAKRASILFQLKRWDEALSAYDRAIILDADDAGLRYYRGFVLYHQRKFRKAVDDLASAEQLGYEDRSTLLQLKACAHFQLREWEQAYDDVTQAIGLSPNLADFYVLRAMTQVKLSDIPAALQDAEMAARLAPDNEEYREFRNQLSEQVARQKL